MHERSTTDTPRSICTYYYLEQAICSPLTSGAKDGTESHTSAGGMRGMGGWVGAGGWTVDAVHPVCMPPSGDWLAVLTAILFPCNTLAHLFYLMSRTHVTFELWRFRGLGLSCIQAFFFIEFFPCHRHHTNQNPNKLTDTSTLWVPRPPGPPYMDPPRPEGKQRSVR